MFKKSFSFLCLLFTALFTFNSVVWAQETEAAASSNLTGVALPAGAQRILPGSVPAEITEVLDKIVAAGEGKFRKGDEETLAWAGAGYKKANAPAIIDRLTGTLKAAGWKYAVEGNEGGVTVFSLFKEGARRRATAAEPRPGAAGAGVGREPGLAPAAVGRDGRERGAADRPPPGRLDHPRRLRRPARGEPGGGAPARRRSLPPRRHPLRGARRAGRPRPPVAAPR